MKNTLSLDIRLGAYHIYQLIYTTARMGTRMCLSVPLIVVLLEFVVFHHEVTPSSAMSDPGSLEDGQSWQASQESAQSLGDHLHVFDVRRRHRRGLMFPGTKWCGPGDNAKDDADLGSDIELDMCCREHDHCNMSIPVNSTKFGLTNWLRYTRSHCDCDETFRECLKNLTKIAGNFIGALFFGGSGVGCFRLDFPARCIDRSSVSEKCLEYTYDTKAPKVWQFFDNKPWRTPTPEDEYSPLPNPTTATTARTNTATGGHPSHLYLLIVPMTFLSFLFVWRTLSAIGLYSNTLAVD